MENELAVLGNQNNYNQPMGSMGHSGDVVSQQRVRLEYSEAVDDSLKAYALRLPSGEVKKFVNLLIGTFTTQNKWAQFDVTNGFASNKDVRIGSRAGLAGSANFFGGTAGIGASAADEVLVVDQYGGAVQKIQGFSTLTLSKAVLISEIKLISADITQLNSAVSYNTINPDGRVTSEEVNIASTSEKSDQRDTVLFVRGAWVLDANHYLEFNSIVAKTLQIALYMEAIENVGGFVSL